MKPPELAYFYGDEAEQFNFYRIPKVLFTGYHYKAVFVEAKILYGPLLDQGALRYHGQEPHWHRFPPSR